MSINDTTYGFPVVRAMQAEIDRLRLATDMLRAELAEHPTWARMYKTAVEENNRLRAELADRELELDRVSIICDGETDALIDSNIERDKLQQAIARVRELCEPGSPVRAAGLAEQVLRALGGGTE